MKQTQDLKAKMRSAALMSEIEIAKKSSHTGAIGLLVRVTLIVVFSYLILTSYVLFDAAGPVFISALFIVALFIPNLYRAVNNRVKRNKSRNMEANLAAKSPQEG
jgi:hypothetical protein